MDARIRKVEEEVEGVKQAQHTCQQGFKRLMQSKRLTKADKILLPVLLKQKDDLVEELQQLRKELEQLRDEKLLLLRQKAGQAAAV